MDTNDAEIQQHVLEELKTDTRIEDAGIRVQVEAGVVTLSGTVSSWAKRHAAEQATHRIAGVLDVANDIAVDLLRSSGTSDTALAHAVRHALLWDVFVPAECIHSTASEGKVTLQGEVSSYSERTDAERAIRNLAGIRWITNNIIVKLPRVDSDALHKLIEEALLRQAECDARRISIEAHEGRVLLTGTVHSQAERTAAQRAVSVAPGVLSVDNRIKVAAAPT